MRGRIAFINPVTRTGLIYGNDRKRYFFPLETWQNATQPSRNLEVSFTALDYQALSVQPFTGQELEQDVFVPPVRPSPPSPPGRVNATTVPEAAVETFRNAQEFSKSTLEGEDADDLFASPAVESLESGEAFPELGASESPYPQIGRVMFTQEDAAPRGLPWKLFLLGMICLLVIAAALYAALRFL
jgi:hypothetical protein